MELKIDCAYDELLDISKLTPNPRNNNRHSIEQIQRLAKIIEFQGMRSPIVVSNRSGFIIKGHCRLEALKELGFEKAPVDYQDYLDEAQEYADMMADNEIARWAELDLHKTITDLKEMDFTLDMDFLGLENNDILADKILDDDENVEIDGDMDFSKEIDEKNDYVVLLFNSKEDFKQAQEKLGIKTVKVYLSAAKEYNSNMEINGMGRVIDGKPIIDRL